MAKQDKKVFVGFTPHEGQIRIWNSIINENYKFYILSMGRNWGKTQLCLNLILFWSINEKGSDILYLGKSDRMAREVYEQAYEALKDTGLIDRNNKTNKELTLVNKSKLRFGTGAVPDNWRGFNTLSHCVIDEMSYQHPELFTKTIQGCLLKNGQKCIMISTPNGYDHFREQWTKSETQKDYKSFTAPTFENSWLPSAAIEEMNFYKEHNPIIYRVEYLAEFVDEYTGVFQNVKECVYGPLDDVPREGQRITCGLDLGRRDATVFTIYDATQDKVVDLLRIQNFGDWENEDESTGVLADIARMYHKWKPVHGYAECNFNDFIVERLRKKYGCFNLKPRYTGDHTKQPMIENLMLKFSKREIKIPENKQLIDELKAYSIRFNKRTGKPSYSGGQINDDCCVSLALACLAASERAHKNTIFWEPI